MTRRQFNSNLPSKSTPALNGQILHGFEVRVFDGEPRVRDIDIAKRLKFKRERDIRKLIERNIEEIQKFGTCATVAHVVRGNPVTEYWLSEEQALLVAVLSDTEEAPNVRHMLIKVFMAWRNGNLQPVNDQYSDPKVQALLARESRMAASVFKSLFKEGGFKGPELLHAVSNATRTLTGFDAIEAANVRYIETDRTESLLLPGELGKKIGLNARYVNILLTDHGYQIREPKKKGGYRYTPTEKGIAAGAKLCRTERSNKTAMEDELRWPASVADILMNIIGENA